MRKSPRIANYPSGVARVAPRFCNKRSLAKYICVTSSARPDEMATTMSTFNSSDERPVGTVQVILARWVRASIVDKKIRCNDEAPSPGQRRSAARHGGRNKHEFWRGRS